jgi:hypothetical protein
VQRCTHQPSEDTHRQPAAACGLSVVHTARCADSLARRPRLGPAELTACAAPGADHTHVHSTHAAEAVSFVASCACMWVARHQPAAAWDAGRQLGAACASMREGLGFPETALVARGHSRTHSSGAVFSRSRAASPLCCPAALTSWGAWVLGCFTSIAFTRELWIWIQSAREMYSGAKRGAAGLLLR